MKKTSRSHHFVVSLVLLLGLCAPPLLAECTKTVLVYLDVSGSMDPEGKKPNSPYRLTIDALDRLLSVSGFLGSGDRILVQPFSNTLLGGEDPVEVAGLSARLQALRTQPSQATTDFAVVFESIEKQVSDNQITNQMLVIIASDFVQDRTNIFEEARSTAEWQDTAEDRSTLLSKFTERPDAPQLLLFVAPAFRPAGYPQVQQRVLKDLSTDAVNTRRQAIGAGVSAEDLVASIRASLGVAPEISGTLVGPRSIKLSVKNPGCANLAIQRLWWGCEGGQGFSGEVAEAKGQRLKANEALPQPLTVELPEDLQCPSLTASVSATNGRSHSVQISRQDKLDFKVLRAEIVPGILPLTRAIEYDVNLWGVLSSSTRFKVRLVDPQGKEIGQQEYDLKGETLPAEPGEVPGARQPFRFVFQNLPLSVRDAYQTKILVATSTEPQGPPESPVYLARLRMWIPQSLNLASFLIALAGIRHILRKKALLEAGQLLENPEDLDPLAEVALYIVPLLMNLVLGALLLLGKLEPPAILGRQPTYILICGFLVLWTSLLLLQEKHLECVQEAVLSSQGGAVESPYVMEMRNAAKRKRLLIGGLLLLLAIVVGLALLDESGSATSITLMPVD